MQTVPQLQRDITYQECTVSGQSLLSYADCSSSPVYHSPYLPHAPPPGSPNLQCHTMTTFQSTLTQTPQTGKTKWKTSSTKQTMQRHSYSPQMQPVSPTPMLFNTFAGGPTYPDPRGPLLPNYDPYYYNAQPQHYYTSNYPSGAVYPNGYRLPTIPPRPYVTITQFNYQPIGYSVPAQPTPTTNLVFGPPPRDRRTVDPQNKFYSSQLMPQYELERPVSPNKNEKTTETNSLKPKLLYVNSMLQQNEEKNNLKSDEKSDSSGSFEFTIQPEQIVNSLCDEKEQECVVSRTDIFRSEEETVGHVYSSPRMWTECDTMNPMRIEDDELTKFIVDGCLKAEAVAVRNQHRPCFKNIKHLCTRTRTDILKPRTTVANIHSQGIPWATKDFIFAFVRLINCWYILKGYLDDHDGSLGKIENTLNAEFKECYQRWQANNKEMVRHLINIFVSLDNGITVQNAEIFSTFNNSQSNIQSNNSAFTSEMQVNDYQQKTGATSKYPFKYNADSDEQSKKIKLQSQSDVLLETNKYNISEVFANDLESCINLKLKHSHSEGRMSVPGILRVKEIFNKATSTNTSPREDDDSDSERECRHKIYMKPGSYRVPKKRHSSPQNCNPPNSDSNEPLDSNVLTQELQDGPNTSNLDSKLSNIDLQSYNTPDDVWKNALESFGPFMKSVMQDTESSYGSQANNSLLQDRASLSHDSSESVDSTYKHKSYKSIRDTQAWIDDHDFASYIKDDIEEMEENPKRIEKRNVHCSMRKSSVNYKSYRKKYDDSDGTKKASKQKLSAAAYNQNGSNVKKHDSNILSSMCYLSRKRLGMSPIITGKFEKIINALWNLQFAKYITFEVNVENVPDYYKYVRRPMFLCKVMSNLKENKYDHPNQVVHDLRTIVRNSEIYIEKRPDWLFEKCLTTFSKELETQLADKFASNDFSSITGELSDIQSFYSNGNSNPLYSDSDYQKTNKYQ